MGLIVEKFLTCDGACGIEPFGVDTRTAWKNVDALREGARENGWAFVDNKDYCYNCKTDTN